jgi:N-methylhydantoinase A
VSRELLIGVDIGGTFTDLVVSDQAADRLHRVKVLTTPDDPVRGVMSAVAEGLRTAGGAAGEVSRFVHATTLATNLVLERKGARVAYVTTKGFGDMFAMGRGFASGAEMFNLLHVRPEGFVPRDMVFELPERIQANGTPVLPLDEEAAHGLVRAIAARTPEAIAVNLLHSYVNDVHERRFGEIVREHLPTTYLALSSRIWPERDEYERGATTLVSAYIGPTIGAYLERLEAELAAHGLTCPLQIMQSNGGIMGAADAAERAVYTLESGPAAGVVSAGRLGHDCGYPNIISFDMGGTTAKAGVVENGKPLITNSFWVGGGASAQAKGGGEPIRLPVIDLAEVGAGGGSIARIDAGGFLRVGPESAGAMPGPACYGQGGTLPTVTDANLVLGYLDPAFFNGGRMALHPELARAAIRDQVAAPLGLGEVEAAWRIHELVNASMGAAVRMVTIYRGLDPRNYVLNAFGGAGPLHAVCVAAEFGIPLVLVAALPGVRSAMGLLESDVAYDFVKAATTLTSEPDLARLNDAFAELEDRARSHATLGGLSLERSFEIRFTHQSVRLRVQIPGGPVDMAVIEQADAQFRSDYFTLTGIRPNDTCTILNCWIDAVASVAKPALRALGDRAGNAGAAPKGVRDAYFPGIGFVATPVFDRERLPADIALQGPALLEEPESTIVLPPGFSLTLDRFGNAVIEAASSGSAAPIQGREMAR